MKNNKPKTVFILGAGASTPYGFPTSRLLREEIIDDFFNKFSHIYKEMPGIDDYYDSFEEDVRAFQNKFDSSSLYSIDSFISRNVSYMQFGKDAIILHLLEHERDSTFREKSKLRNEDWYFYLYNYIVNDIKQRALFQNITDNNFTFITYNYDRSLEHFLIDSLSNLFEDISYNDLQDIFSRMPIIHVYGKISSIYLQDPQQTTVRYGEEINFSKLTQLRKNIKIIGDNIDQVSQTTKNIIRNADRIFFLGFGYDKINLANLNIPDLLHAGHKIYGTTLGYNERFTNDLRDYLIQENLEYKNSIRKAYPKTMTSRNIIFEPVDSLTLLEKYL